MITWDSFIEQIAQYEPPAAAVAVGADIAHAFREEFLRLRMQPTGRAFVRGVPVFVDHELPRDGFRALREVPE